MGSITPIKKDFDAVVVGAGPNGLAAAITLQQQGLSVLLLEGKNTIGGGMRTMELTLPGYYHDVCAAIHPLAVASPFFQSLPLPQFGLQFLYPDIAAAHPFENGSAAVLQKDIQLTAGSLEQDAAAYTQLITPLVERWPCIAADVLAPLHWPADPLAMAGFGTRALQPATSLVKIFHGTKARGLWAGMAAHSMLPLSGIATSAVGLVLLITAHRQGWPVPKGGSGAIALAMADYFRSIGGKIETGHYVKTLNQLPSAKAILFDVTPRQLLQIAGHQFSSIYKWQLERYRYGMGVFKIDWALDAPIPFTNEACRSAGTVHIGNTLEEIAMNESLSWHGMNPLKPFVLLAQQSLFDASRAPEGKHTAWAYCHVPHGATTDMTEAIEKQVERFAPGFRDRVLARHVFNPAAMEAYNPNYIGGDINGGAIDWLQLFTRPALRWSPYRTSAKGMYICSSSTPPGGGVHGMCGYWAAKQALRDIFHIHL